VDVTDLDADPLRQLATWLNAARAAGQLMPEAMTVASATSGAVPSARMVVLRGLRRGLVFFTDCESDKGAELAANPRAAARAALACSGPPPGTRGGTG
jgi:pyridoxamine 5'-phosphate oxidase